MVKNITKLYMYIYTQSWRFHKGKIASLKTGHFACIYICIYAKPHFCSQIEQGLTFFAYCPMPQKWQIYMCYIFLYNILKTIYTPFAMFPLFHDYNIYKYFLSVIFVALVKLRAIQYWEISWFQKGCRLKLKYVLTKFQS